jgi:hypothetical protein
MNIEQNSKAMFSLKNLTLVGICTLVELEPGSSVSLVDAMTTAPRRLGMETVLWSGFESRQDIRLFGKQSRVVNKMTESAVFVR